MGAAPVADLSVLLLTICLITHAPALGYKPAHGTTQPDKQSLYLTTRSLLTQVQVSCSPSVRIVQAGLLLAVYEYMHGRPDDALATLAGSARIAYAARIHVHDRQDTDVASLTSGNMNADLLLQAEEAANTWWGIVICERYVPDRGTWQES